MGRMKVELTNDSGKPAVPTIPTSTLLYYSEKKMLEQIGLRLRELRQKK